MTRLELIWVIIGFGGQAMFSARFIIQWLLSEKLKKSVIPIQFWYFSLAGGVILLTYAIHKQDIVFIAGQFFGLFIYSRNLILIYKYKQNLESMSS